MTVKSQVNAILNKKMDRQDFIKHVAVGVVAISGVGSALKIMSPKPKEAAVTGYGSSAYGGSKPSQS